MGGSRWAMEEHRPEMRPEKLVEMEKVGVGCTGRRNLVAWVPSRDRRVPAPLGNPPFLSLSGSGEFARQMYRERKVAVEVVSTQ